MKVVILAGGKGTRLRPYTTVFPKPLMPIGEKPILEIIIRQLRSHGLSDIIVTVGHLAELITNFFGDGSKFGVNISYSREDQPLGTAGGLGLISDQLQETFLMINGDTLTTLDYTELIECHRAGGAIATIALNKRSVYVDFGIIDLDEFSNMKGYIEKPTISHLVSMGVNVLEPRILDYIPPGERLDLPDLLRSAVEHGDVVKGFRFDGYWLDIGRPEDYEKANEDMSTLYKKLGISDG